MSSDSRSKVQALHLKRNAYVYIRQSSPRQVLENVESTKRQYELRQRAIALGWSIDQVIIIVVEDERVCKCTDLQQPANRWSFALVVIPPVPSRSRRVRGSPVRWVF